MQDLGADDASLSVYGKIMMQCKDDEQGRRI